MKCKNCQREILQNGFDEWLHPVKDFSKYNPKLVKYRADKPKCSNPEPVKP